MSSPSAWLARQLALRAEQVCRTYLDQGHKRGRYWVVGDVFNTPGQSLYVRLVGPESGPGAVGKWTDAATSEHGDLLDLVRLNRSLHAFRDLKDEVLSFLKLPEPPRDDRRGRPWVAEPDGAMQRLFAASRPVPGTLAGRYLRARGITAALASGNLRFHPACFYREGNGDLQRWPALIARVSDIAGRMTGLHRTYLSRDGMAKAPLATPRLAKGSLLGHAVWLQSPGEALAAGEGLETMLALRSVLPTLPMAAALSAAHLGLLELPASLRRLYIAHDHDPPGERAAIRLTQRMEGRPLTVHRLTPAGKDWNDDLLAYGAQGVQQRLRLLLEPADHRHLGCWADAAGAGEGVSLLSPFCGATGAASFEAGE